jgi:hypothetical protein
VEHELICACLFQEICSLKSHHDERVEEMSGMLRGLEGSEERRREELEAAHRELRDLSANIATLREQVREHRSPAPTTPASCVFISSCSESINNLMSILSADRS